MPKRNAIKSGATQYVDSDMIEPDAGDLVERTNRSEWLDNPLEGLDQEIEELARKLQKIRP